MPDQYSHEELKEKVRTGWVLSPDTPGLMNAARAVLRPLIERIRGQKIIYRYRVAFLMRVDELTVDEGKFRAEATVLHEYPDPEMEQFSPGFTTPFNFHASWSMMRLSGNAIALAMCADCFIVDQDVIAAVEAAATRGETPEAVNRIVSRACNPATNLQILHARADSSASPTRTSATTSPASRRGKPDELEPPF